MGIIRLSDSEIPAARRPTHEPALPGCEVCMRTNLQRAPELRVEVDVEAQLLHLPLPLRRPTKLGRILAAADGRT